MKVMKLRVLLIGGINAIIAAGLLSVKGYSGIYMGYLVVGICVFLIGLLLR